MAMNKTAKMLALGAATALGSLSAQAADKELLDMLLQNGAINQTQYDSLIKKETLSKQDVSDVKIKLDKKGLQVESGDGDFKLALGGRLHADATFHSNDGLATDPTSGTEIRRARIFLKGTFWKDFFFKSQFDFADNKTSVKDMYLGYSGLDWMQIIVGNQKQPISQELQESSNDIMFTERSLLAGITEHAFDRAIGINLKSSGDNWHAQIGAYGDSLSASSQPGDEGWGVGARASYAPINEKDHVVHLGTYGGYREVSDANGLYSGGSTSARLRNETTHMSNFYLTDTTAINDADSITLAGFEAAYMTGPFSVQGEYLYSWLDRQNSTSAEFDGLYVQTAWTLTGESRTYKGSEGKFHRLKPAKNFSLKNGGMGAVELAARYDQIDLSSNGSVNGGHQKGVTVAVNWYLNENVRFMADYRRAFDVKGSPASSSASGRVEDQDIVTLRAQWAF